MTEVLFYHLHRVAVERVLPDLLQRSFDRGWLVSVQCSSQERVEALDAHLWTFRDDSFLPHGVGRDAAASEQPILIVADAANLNGATVRFLIDGAPLPDDAATYTRIVLLFDGEDDEAVAEARTRWAAAKSQGFELTYWQPDERGRWQRRA